jgi:uncharacterized membrane protein (UPF0127 family)
MPSFLEPLLKEPHVRFGLRILRTGGLLATEVESAVDSETRRRGLLGRTGLADGVAMVIAPTNAIHTFFMRFPIDVVFVRRDGGVLKVRRAVPAWRMAFAVRGFAVVELAGGAADRAGLRVGDRLVVEPATPVQSGSLPT